MGPAEAISSPALITQVENGVLGNSAGAFFDRLTCPKTPMRFTAAEGADRHWEMGTPGIKRVSCRYVFDIRLAARSRIADRKCHGSAEPRLT